MTAIDQCQLLRRIERDLEDARLAASQLPGGQPLVAKLHDAHSLASAWRCDQEAELPAEELDV